MMYIKVPDKVKVDRIEKIPEYTEVFKLLLKNNYRIVEFSNSAIKFYNTEVVIYDAGHRAVPVHNLFVMSTREFSAFIDVVKKLDALNTKLKKYASFVASNM